MPINWVFKFRCSNDIERISVIVLFSLVLFVSSSIFSSNTHLSLSPSTVVLAQSSLSSPLDLLTEPLFENATNSLKQNNTAEAKKYLDLIQSSIEKIRPNTSSSLDNIKFLLGNTMDSLNNNNISEALIYINLANSSIPSISDTGPSNNSILGSIDDKDFKLYANPFRGLQLEYPNHWTTIEYPYNALSNNTIVGFFSNQKTSSELGNVSGVSGNFVPYIDVYEFDSKNITLNDLSESIKNRFDNKTNFAVNDSKIISMNDGREGFEIVYDVIVGREEQLKKVQTYTILEDKAYVISFTSQRDLFDQYLPSISYAIRSLEPIDRAS